MARRRLIPVVAICALLALPSFAAAAPAPEPYRHNDFGGFHDILPPGTNGLVDAADFTLFQLNGTRPPHSDDQYAMYQDLLYGTPGVQNVGDFYKDSSFGVPPGHVERTYSPRGDVTIIRDSDFGVPHVYGATRAGAMFGLGYVAAEDRLFFIDLLRHAGRAQLSSFAGGGQRAMDRSVWADTPYREADLTKQIQFRPPGFEQETDQLRDDLMNFSAGINKYIDEAMSDPDKLPAEYAAFGKTPEPWVPEDVISEGALIGGIFGKGGGGELDSALALQAAIDKFGPRAGRRVWADFRSAEDPEAPTTVSRTRFPYQVPPSNPRDVALPDPGTLKPANVVQATTLPRQSARASGGPELLPDVARTIEQMKGTGHSNALLVSARESSNGRPQAVMGPQVSYFAPQILMEQDVHAPTIDARGAAFPGVNLYVQLGRGRDYSFSATSAGQDIIDTFAVPLCETDGSRATRSSDHYLFRGRCLPIDVLTRTNSWVPSAGDMTAAGSDTLRAERTKLGIVIGRAKVNGKAVAYTKLRSTYFHEVDSGLGFAYYNNPNKMENVGEFQKAANLINLTFNWFYADDQDIGYFNSGWNPVRAPRSDPNFPVLGVPRNYWRGWNGATHVERVTPFREHPQVINQGVITSWNNKLASGFRAADGNYEYGSTYRSTMLDDEIRRRLRGNDKISLTELIDAMELAGTTDLRGEAVLPHAIDVMQSRPITDSDSRTAVNQLRAWVRTGAHRIDKDQNGRYERSRAIRIMDAWWPMWLRAEFKRTLGQNLFTTMRGMLAFDDANREHGLGSAFQGGWFGYAKKDLRSVLGGNVIGPYSRQYCGRGNLRACRRALLRTLHHSLHKNPYGQNSGCGLGTDQACFDAIRFSAASAIAQPQMPWVNRPTYQQAVNIQGHRPR